MMEILWLHHFSVNKIFGYWPCDAFRHAEMKVSAATRTSAGVMPGL
jgi:hypothetical protein